MSDAPSLAHNRLLNFSNCRSFETNFLSLLSKKIPRLTPVLPFCCCSSTLVQLLLLLLLFVLVLSAITQSAAAATGLT